jgi:hypothetical protein
MPVPNDHHLAPGCDSLVPEVIGGCSLTRPMGAHEEMLHSSTGAGGWLAAIHASTVLAACR